MNSSRAIVIGAGFSGISAAASLARQGHDVVVLEKNVGPGGRAGVFQEQGFTFDMGPSWYWMPEVFEEWFARFGAQVKDHYDLQRLDPSYQVIFSDTDAWRIPSSSTELEALFEAVEAGAGRRLRAFLAGARVNYEMSMSDLVRSPALSWMEFVKPKVLANLMGTKLFRSLRSHVARSFKDDRLRLLLEFPVLFLGAPPERTPALYSLMNHADMGLGTWYPSGGMGSVVQGMVRVAEAEGAQFHFNSPVERIIVEDNQAVGVVMNGSALRADVIVAAADYHHVENSLLEKRYRNYDDDYWDSRVMAPSALIFYWGFDRRLPELEHHNLFFDRSLDLHMREIYDAPQWPSDPLMYICAPSRTDATVAPSGCENVFVLLPVAAGLQDTPDVREHYREAVLDRLSRHCGTDIRPHLTLDRSYCINDFKADHNAYRGNAYGLANTLRQTAVLKPKMKNQKVQGLYYAGQLTVPGPGIPPAIISGTIVADLIQKETASLAAIS